MRQAQALAGGAELSSSDVAERYQAVVKADVTASASEAASHCGPAIDALVGRRSPPPNNPSARVGNAEPRPAAVATMNAQATRQMLNSLLAELYTKQAQLAEEDQETARDIAAVERTMSILEAKPNEPKDKVTAADIAHCRTQRAALREIARLNEGIVRATEAGDLILAAGLSEAQRSSIITTIHRYMSQSDDWEWTEPGTFRLKTLAPPGA